MVSLKVFAWYRRVLDRGKHQTELANRELLNSAIRRRDLDAAEQLLDGRPLAMGCVMDSEGCNTAIDLAERHGCEEIAALIRGSLNRRV